MANFVTIIFIYITISCAYSRGSRTKRSSLDLLHDGTEEHIHRKGYASQSAHFIVHQNEVMMVSKIHYKESLHECKTKYLPIEIDLTSVADPNKKETHIGYLQDGKETIKIEQEKTETCRKVSKFQIDDKKTIVNVNGELELVDAAKVDRVIAWKLANDFDLWAFVLFITNCYDDMHDKIDWTRAFKSANFFYGLFMIFRHLWKIAKFVLRKLEQLMDWLTTNVFQDDFRHLRIEVVRAAPQEATQNVTEDQGSLPHVPNVSPNAQQNLATKKKS